MIGCTGAVAPRLFGNARSVGVPQPADCACRQSHRDSELVLLPAIDVATLRGTYLAAHVRSARLKRLRVVPSCERAM